MARLLRFTGFALLVLGLLVAGFIVHVWFEGRHGPGRPQYVAMGSSFASGPAITHAADHSPWFCARSADNYAHQLARLRNLSLLDVSCGGATTRHIIEGKQALQPPQVDAVTNETELVTVTIGGNDIGYVANLMAMGCDDDTPMWIDKVGGCRVRELAEMEAALPGLLERLATIVSEVKRRAPKAQVVLVSYPVILPEEGTCDRLGLSEDEVATMRIVAQKLHDVTYAAAEGNGALFFDAAAASKDHDACATEPWMNGLHPEGGMLGAPLHPTLESMTAIAKGLHAQLGGRMNESPESPVSTGEE